VRRQPALHALLFDRNRDGGAWKMMYRNALPPFPLTATCLKVGGAVRQGTGISMLESTPLLLPGWDGFKHTCAASIGGALQTGSPGARIHHP
jgi:hypothetical protein